MLAADDAGIWQCRTKLGFLKLGKIFVKVSHKGEIVYNKQAAVGFGVLVVKNKGIKAYFLYKFLPCILPAAVVYLCFFIKFEYYISLKAAERNSVGQTIRFKLPC